jgi:phosphatidylglycerophosphate synthase
LLSVTPNFITIFSLFSVFAAIPFLFQGNKILFFILMFISYTLDNIDGTWARIKNQTSDFGKFLDRFLDEIKDFILDLSFFIFYFERINQLIEEKKLLLSIIVLYFIFKCLFYIVRDYRDNSVFSFLNNKRSTKISFLSYGCAEKYLIVFPLMSIFPLIFILYTLIYLPLYFINILIFVFKIKNNFEQKHL